MHICTNTAYVCRSAHFEKIITKFNCCVKFSERFLLTFIYSLYGDIKLIAAQTCGGRFA